MEQSTDPSRFAVETMWLRAYARGYECDVICDDADLESTGLMLVDVLNIFREGLVIDADKTDANGARWRVEGPADEGEVFHIDMIVATQDYYVEVERVQRAKGQSHERHSAA